MFVFRGRRADMIKVSVAFHDERHLRSGVLDVDRAGGHRLSRFSAAEIEDLQVEAVFFENAELVADIYGMMASEVALAFPTVSVVSAEAGFVVQRSMAAMAAKVLSRDALFIEPIPLACHVVAHFRHVRQRIQQHQRLPRQLSASGRRDFRRLEIPLC